MTFFELIKKFPTEQSVIDHFITVRYPDGIKCNHCGNTHVYHKTNKPKLFQSPKCRNTFFTLQEYNL